MCTEQSYPIIEVMVVDRPTSVAVPGLFHPPPLLNSVKTALGLFRGASTHKGMIIANNPMTWRIKINPSTMGKFLARKVLKRIENVVIAIINKVPCQRWKSYVESLSTMRPWMMVPARNAMDTIAHCHPIAQSQPNVVSYLMTEDGPWHQYPWYSSGTSGICEERTRIPNDTDPQMSEPC